jgi:serine/threonine protein kinase
LEREGLEQSLKLNSAMTLAAVKRMDKVSRQAEEEFCREMELLARLHHHHLVTLKGFCIERKER